MKSLKRFLHHLLIPQEGNNFRAKAIHLDFLTYYLLFAVFLAFGFKILYVKSGDVLGYATDITIDKLYQLTNNIRQQNQLISFTYSDKLALAAQKKVQDMFAKNYWSHYAPDGTTPWDFMRSSDYQYEFAGENLAKNFLFSQGVVDAWMTSPSHRENMLRKDYSEVGFAVMNGVLNGEQTTLVVEMFGKPLITSIAKVNQNNNLPEIRPNVVEAQTVPTSNPTVPKQQTILAQSSSQQKSGLTKFSFNSSLAFLSFLILAFVLDLYFANKLRVIRITGKNIAHLIFLGFIFIGLLLLTKGSII